MDLLLQLLVNSIVNGSQYALIGTAFGLILATTRIAHFAFGPIYALAACVAWFAAMQGVPLWGATMIAALASAVVGGGSYLFLYRPLQAKNDSPLIPLLASLGLFFIIQNGIAILFGSGIKALDNASFSVFFVGPIFVTEIAVLQVLATVLVIGALALFLRWTRYGKAILAMTDNPEMARIVGVNTTVVSLLVFVIASAMAAVPAVLIMLKDGASSQMGFHAVFLAFVVVVLGGVGSIRGAVVGGFLFGFIESAGLWKIPTEWQSSIAFFVLFLVLLVRPNGIFAAKTR